MRTFCLSIKIHPNDIDRALTVVSDCDTLGCSEKTQEELVCLDCFFGNMTDALSAEYALMDNLILPEPVKFSVIPQEDWNAQWRKNMEPARLSESIWVSPAWLRPPLGPGERWIVIEPKMAFGSGHHESTRLAAWGIEQLSVLLAPRSIGLDIGTGSGVLSFAANLNGAGYCVGCDIDRVVAENLAENRSANAGICRSGFFIGTLDALKAHAGFDFACMNMILSESAPLLKSVRALLTENGYLVWSGLLKTERDDVLQMVSDAGFVIHAENTENEWWACVIRKSV